MEGGIVIATEDNTQIFINGATTPVATINAGEWYRINETNYVEQNAEADISICSFPLLKMYIYISW
jgi:hypothetical protein